MIVKYDSCELDNLRYNYIQAKYTSVPAEKGVYIYYVNNKMKIKKYCTVQTVPQSNRKIVEIDKFDTPNTQIHEHLKCT